jgi:hypothetical protein
VLGHTAFSSELSSVTQSFYIDNDPEKTIEDIQKNANRLGAENIWIGHNHPSGNAKHSERDYAVSSLYDSFLRDKGIHYCGSITTDSIYYTLSLPLDEILFTKYHHDILAQNTLPKEFYDSCSDNLLTSRIPGNPEKYISKYLTDAPQLNTPEKTASIFKDYFKTKEPLTIYAASDHRLRLVSFTEADPNQIQTPDDFKKIKEYLKKSGGANIHLLTNDVDTFNKYLSFSKANLKGTYDIVYDLSLLDKNSSELLNSLENPLASSSNYRYWEIIDSTAPVRILVNTASLESGRDPGDGGRDPGGNEPPKPHSPAPQEATASQEPDKKTYKENNYLDFIPQ